MRIALWAGPRSGSTALMYSFAQRSDTRVVDEPLFGHFLALTGAKRPSRQEVMATMPTEMDQALATIQVGPNDQHVFFKHMANHIEGIPFSLLDGDDVKHVLLIRHPDGVLPSYQVHVENPTMLDLGYAHQRLLFEHLGERALVLTAEQLHAQPEESLQALCKALELTWEKRMMHWRPGPRPEDGVWAKYWYQGIHQSSGWEARPLVRQNGPANLQSLRDACLEHYLALSEKAIALP